MNRIAVAAPTADRIAAFKAICKEMGATVRVRKLSGSLRNAIRVVIVSGNRDMICNAALMTDAVATSGRPPLDPQFFNAFNGDQINLYFTA